MTNHPNRKRSSDITVKLIRRYSGFANVPDAFQVMEPGAWVDEYNETTEEYYLPAGYQVAKSIGELEIYDPENNHCEIVEHRPSGRPQLVSTAREMPVLKRKPDADAA